LQSKNSFNSFIGFLTEEEAYQALQEFRLRYSPNQDENLDVQV